MLDKVGSIEFEDKIKEIFNKLKYFLFLLPLIIIVLIIKHYTTTYGEVEDKLVKLAKKYVNDNSVNVTSETYIPLGDLGEVEGAELCSNASGVIVTNTNNKYKYKAYLKCEDYETKLISNSDKYINLSGNTVTILNKGEIFEEKGYFTEELLDVEISGEVLNNPGIYTLKYNVLIEGDLKQTLERKVIITNYDKANNNGGVIDKDKPTLTLLGNKTMVLEKNEKFVEPGYKAVDYKDGKISRKVVRVDKYKDKDITKTLGSHILIYSITNSRGETEIKTRTIKVVDKKSDIVIDSSVNKTSDGLQIVLKISGSEYTKTLLPNGETINDTVITYPVSKNDVYSFAIYDVYNNVTVREVSVNDIDVKGPTGSCAASISNLKTTVYVSATDSSGINSYNYILDGTSTGFIQNASYTSYQSLREAKVQVKDIYGNISTFNCQINKSKGTISNGVMNIPLLMQTNYTTPIKWYGGTTTVKSKGCGPTSVSMVITYLTGNSTQNPQIIFEWLNNLGYFHGYGFGKAALTKAAAKYGVSCTWQNLTEASMKQTLLSGQPIIAFMGKGQFSSGGHYIVLKGVDSQGKILVNDPFYKKNNNQSFDASLILKEKRVSQSFAVCY